MTSVRLIWSYLSCVFGWFGLLETSKVMDDPEFEVRGDHESHDFAWVENYLGLYRAAQKCSQLTSNQVGVPWVPPINWRCSGK